MAILNTIEFSRRWCKLDFAPLRGQFKSCHFPERIDGRRKNIYFLYKIIGIIRRKRLVQPFWIMIWIYYCLLNRFRLDLDLDNSCWNKKIPNFATNNIWYIWYSHTKHLSSHTYHGFSCIKHSLASGNRTS